MTQDQIKTLIAKYNSDIKRFESYIEDQTLPQDKYMYSQMTINNLEQKILALQQQLVAGPVNQQLPMSATGTLSTEAMIAKIDATIQRYQSLIDNE